MPIKTMQEMFIHELGNILDAERQLLKDQAEMAKNATDATLKAGIERWTWPRIAVGASATARRCAPARSAH